MLVHKPDDDEGFGLVEMVIAFFLLAIIAVAILPGLWNGIRYSSQQSTVATATRQLNRVVEAARALSQPSCADVQTAIADPSLTSFTDGRNRTLTVQEVTTCGTGTVNLALTALDGTTVVATLNALVYTR